MRQARLWLGALSLGALSLGALSLGACRGSTKVGPPVITAPASAEAKPAPPKKDAVALPEMQIVLDDSRLAVARAFERAKDWPAAAKALQEARPEDLPRPSACAWDFLEGRLFELADALPEAIAAFERAADDACPLAAYAKLRSAQALAREGRAEEALARARSVPEDVATLRDEVNRLVAEQLAAQGDRAGALPLWRAWLAANPRGPRWVDTSVRIATALLDGVDGAPEERAREAYDVLTRVVVEAPKLADGSGATEARERAIALVRAKEPKSKVALTDEQLARQAQAWLDSNEPALAFDLASTLLKSSSSAIACRAAVTRARAAARKVPKADAWADAVTACDKQPELVTALFAGARARTGKDPKRAIEWFAKVEERFPKHRFADDARLRGALLIAQSDEEGQKERFEKMLLSLPDDYPDGDMRAEGLFRLALTKMSSGKKEDWEAAVPIFDRLIELTVDDRNWVTAGRGEYFRARAAVIMGDAENALERWERVVEAYPLSYYMLLSYARIAEVDAERAKRVLMAAASRAGEGAFPSRAHEVFEHPSFRRALRLLEVGDVDYARREMRASGALADDADPEVVWTVGALYNRAGYPELGHSFSRRRLTDHLAYYPEGKWRPRWETAYPRAFEPLVKMACEKFSLPRPIAWGVMREESGFVAEARSPANAFGLMQIIIPTARGLVAGTGYTSDEASLKRPEVSIELGTKLLSALRRRHGHDALALGAYNAGSGAVGRWMRNRTSEELDLFVENVPYQETRNYIKRVLSSAAVYAYLYDRPSLERALAIPLRLEQ